MLDWDEFPFSTPNFETGVLTYFPLAKNEWANGGIGRHVAFRALWPQGRGGSSPLSTTNQNFPAKLDNSDWVNSLRT